MNYLMKKAVNLNGQDMMLTPVDIDFAHRTISLTGEIDDDAAAVMNSALRCLARDSEEDITIYIQSPGGSVSAGFSIYDTVKALKCDVATVACGIAVACLFTVSGPRPMLVPARVPRRPLRTRRSKEGYQLLRKLQRKSLSAVESAKL